MNSFELSVIKTIEQFNMINVGETIVVGVSGGADSVALLYALNAIKDVYNITLVCAHLNHGIRDNEADRDMEYVKRICGILGIECFCKCISVPEISKQQKISEELCGRTERYRFFNEVASKKGASKIAVAHNKNDSVETVLIKLTRGCNLNGLKGISPINNNIIRPFIQTERSDIEKYLADGNIDFMTDSTNLNNIYTRNIIRNVIIPELSKINPNFISTVFNNSINIADDDSYIEQQAAKYCKKYVQTVNNSVTIDLNAISDLHISLKNRIILYAVSLINGSKVDIESKHINILANLTQTGKKYDISANIKARTEYGKLILSNEHPTTSDYEYNIDINKEYSVCGMRIKFELIDNTELCKNAMYVAADNIKTITLRNRRSGDSFVPSGMTSHKKLSRFFIDAKIPVSIRNTVPLLCINGEIAAILGYRVSNNYIINKTNKILKITVNGGTNEQTQ